MRLIDADALKAELEELHPLNWTDSEAEVQEQNDFELFESLINSAPTIDAVPKHQLSEETSTLDICPYYHHELTGEPFCEMEDRRHGTWEDIDGDGTYWLCSVCGEVLCCNNNFCPNCGAKMDGERREE